MCNDSEDVLSLFVGRNRREISNEIRSRILFIGIMEQKRESDNRVLRMGVKKKGQKNRDTFSMYACHPCAGTMLIFSVSFQFFQMTSEEVPNNNADQRLFKARRNWKNISYGFTNLFLFQYFYLFLVYLFDNYHDHTSAQAISSSNCKTLLYSFLGYDIIVILFID